MSKQNMEPEETINSVLCDVNAYESISLANDDVNDLLAICSSLKEFLECTDNLGEFNEWLARDKPAKD